MASQSQSEASWRAISTTVLIYAIGELIAHHLLVGKMTANIPDDLRPEPDPLQELTTGHLHFYAKHLPKVFFATLGRAIRDYEWQSWLERKYPGWVLGSGRHEAMVYSEANAEKLRDILEDDELQEQMLERLIASGKAQRPSPWLNTVAKWFLDNCIAVTAFGLINALTSSLWAGDPSILFSFLTIHMWVTPLLHFFSIKPLVSFISFIFVPVQHRITVLAGVDVVASVFLSVFLNGAAAWIVSQDWAVELMRNASATAENLSNTTVEFDGVKFVEAGNVVSLGESAGTGENGTIAWKGARALGDEL